MTGWRRCLAFLAVPGCLLAGHTALADASPAAPQSAASNDGIDAPGFVRVQSKASGGSGAFVDVPAYGACRVVTIDDPTIGGEAILMTSAASWLYWRSHRQDSWQAVCCRPGSTALCQGATGGQVAVAINGPGTNGYAQLGATVTVAASCDNPPYGRYVDQQSFTCGQSGSGVMADGQWTGGGNSDNCTVGANPYTIYGACSASCGSGNQLRTVYDSCGKPVSQAYDGPACNNGACCQSDGSCSGGCGGGWGSDNCGNSCRNTSACAAPVTTTYYAACQPMWCGPPANNNLGSGYACDCNYWPGGVSGAGSQTDKLAIPVIPYTIKNDTDPWYWNTSGNPGPGNGNMLLPYPDCSGSGCTGAPPYQNCPGVVTDWTDWHEPKADHLPIAATFTCTQ